MESEDQIFLSIKKKKIDNIGKYDRDIIATIRVSVIMGLKYS